MNPRRFRGVAVVAAAFLLAASAAACITTDQPTPIYVYLTPSPEVTVEATLAPTVSPPAAATETASESAGASAGASDSALPSLVATPDSTSLPGEDCVGSAGNKAFFVDAARGVKAAIFCTSHMPSGWTLSVGNWHGNSSGGWLDVTYRFKKTSQTIQIEEGAFCMNATPTICTGGPLATVQSGVAFDGMATNLVTNGGAGEFEMIVNPGKYNAYFLLAHNVPKATVIAVGANMKIVPKS